MANIATKTPSGGGGLVARLVVSTKMLRLYAPLHGVTTTEVF